MFHGRHLSLMVSRASQLGPSPEVLDAKPREFALHDMVEGMYCTEPRMGILDIEEAPPRADYTAPTPRNISNQAGERGGEGHKGSWHP